MASNNTGVQQNFEQANTSPYHCKECGLYFNSAESLECHIEYRHENIVKWTTQAQAQASHSEETNNNTKITNIKREFIPNNTIAAAADSSENNIMTIKKSPDYSRTTPETIFGHPPTPQSYQSASSPYQNHDNSTFSPNYQYQIKTERNSSSSPNNAHYQQNNYNNFNDPQFFSMDASQGQQQYPQDFPIHNHKAPVQNSSYRYHPYQQQSQYERPQSNSQVSSSSPAYPPQPTPSPSPKQCDKCGYVCDSASLLIEHLNMAHPPTPYHHPNQHFMFNNDQPQIKQEDDAQSEILDLDSHKVHQVYPEEEPNNIKRQNGDNNPHSVSALLNSWSPPQQQKMFAAQEHQRMFSPDPKLFQPHMHSQEFMGNSVSTTSQENNLPPQAYRPFEHLPAQPNPPVISSTQVINNPNNSAPTSGGGGGGGSGTKAANWKSNEARRPKTYNCTACNKWFTSSGHLKRHYNTTLHKNAVKSSGQPDPAAMPISAHHHPARDPNPNKDDQNTNSPGEEDTNSMPPQFERGNSGIPGLLQQPPNGPYDRQPPNIHHTPPLHLANPAASNLTNLSNGSPPNGDAGLSPTTSLDSRGLLSLSTTPNTHGFSMAPPPHMMPIENSQFQMYPNGSAPHVTQVTAINSPSIIGEFSPNSLIEAVSLQENQHQPLPSFAQFQAHRYGLIMSYGNANVGGGGPATAPYCYYQEPLIGFDNNETRTLMYKTEDEEYRLTVLTVADPAPIQAADESLVYSPTTINNNNNNIEEEDDPYEYKYQPPVSPEKAHTSRKRANNNNNNNNSNKNKTGYEESTTIIGSPQISSTTPSIYTPRVDDIPINNNNNNIEEEDDPYEYKYQPPVSPEKAHTSRKRANNNNNNNNSNKNKTGYEESTTIIGSPQISSTTPSIYTPRGPSTSKNSSSSLSGLNNKTVHRCDDCDKLFNKACYLTQHNKTFHCGDKPFKCTRCGKRFSSENTYQSHLAKHAGDKPYKCDICPKQFNHKTDLRRHMCLHSGNKPYSCDNCGKGFIRKDHMLKHVETHYRKAQCKIAAMRS